MNGVQTRLKCKPNVKRCKRFVFAAHSPLLHPNTLKTKAIIHFQTDHILTRFVFPPLYADLYEKYPYLNITEWSVADVNGDLAQCGLSGSPTKVKTIQNISFQAKESKTLTGSDKDVEDLIVELLANHTIG